MLGSMLDDVFGLELLQLGSWGAARELLSASRIRRQTVIADVRRSDVDVVASLSALPVQTASIDAVLLPHTLEFEADPHAIVREADRVLTASADGTAKIWDGQTGKELVTFRNPHHFIVHNAAFFPDGAHILTMDVTAKFWDAATGKPLRDYGPMGRVAGLVFSADGKRMAGGTENTVTIWDTPVVL